MTCTVVQNLGTLYVGSATQHDTAGLLKGSDYSVDIARAWQTLLGRRCEQKIRGEWGIVPSMSAPDVARDMLETRASTSSSACRSV